MRPADWLLAGTAVSRWVVLESWEGMGWMTAIWGGEGRMDQRDGSLPSMSRSAKLQPRGTFQTDKAHSSLAEIE